MASPHRFPFEDDDRPSGSVQPLSQADLQAPNPATGLIFVGEGRQGVVHRGDLLGGLLHEYRRAG